MIIFNDISLRQTEVMSPKYPPQPSIIVHKVMRNMRNVKVRFNVDLGVFYMFKGSL